MCYALLVVQAGDDDAPPGPPRSGLPVPVGPLAVKLASLGIVILMVGDWTDLLHLPLALLGEQWCTYHSPQVLVS
uniref:Transmembrane protein 82-like n=1 Tax=Petromyzon marinus TaxID=7757 RepID=A0AAJ7SLU2_PETMA|nr:transmembrane protein 82-like [Petromyzon marinus]XP_032801032.1 transmembrane protein 82-like [Petromyzon marinus]